MIARSDAAGLERAVLSALPHVDEIVISVDARSDDETKAVASAYADSYASFNASDLDLSEDEWKADRIHFANARNFGRRRVKCPWVMFLDTDQYLHRSVDLRDVVKRAEESGIFALAPIERHGGVSEHRDRQRIARTSAKWRSATHNQLEEQGPVAAVDAVIENDQGLRGNDETERRNAQRDDGIDRLLENANNGDLAALFHVVKHKLAYPITEETIALAKDFRLRAEVHGALADHRSWIAFLCAARLYAEGNPVESELWALRAMLDGPRAEAMALLGDIAQDQGDLQRALAWYEASCAVPEMGVLKSREVLDMRYGRRDSIRRAMVPAA